MAWLDLAAALLAVTTILLLGLDYAWRRLTFSMRKLAPWAVGGWIILLMAVTAFWIEGFPH